MERYRCNCCGRVLDHSEVFFTHDDNLNELYVHCKHCDSDEVFELEEEEEEEEEEEGEDEY